jgi:uncharacterized repeat protein (TIGR02543 family)
MPIYLGTTKIYNPPFGTTVVDKVYLGTEPVFARMTLNFDEQGGSAVTNKTVYYLDTYGTLPTSSRTYYDFNGWYTASSGGSNITSSSIVNDIDNHTLYAQWLADPVLQSTDVVFEEALEDTLVYTVYNNNPYSVTCYFEATDPDPDLFSVTIGANSQNYAVITGLNSGTLYSTYFKLVADGNQSAIINKANSTASGGASDWVLIGTSMSGTSYPYNSTASRTSYTSCPTTSVIDSWLTSSYPPGNYSVGHVIRAYVATRYGTSCGYYWFEAQ